MRSSELVVVGRNGGADSVRLVSSRDGIKENVGCVVVEMRAQQHRTDEKEVN